MTLERAIDIIRNYVDQDLYGCDPEWVREVLVDRCGCTLDELKELGLDVIFPDNYWEQVN